MSSNDCAGGPNDQLTRNLVDDLLREPKCAYVKFVHDVPYHQACMVDGLVERVQQLTTELADTQRSLKAANGLTDEVRIRLHEVQSDAVRERANTNNLGRSLARLQLQANGWKEESEQLRKERDQLREEVNEMESCANKVGYDNKQLKEELDLLNRNHAKLLAVRDATLVEQKTRIESLNKAIELVQGAKEDRSTDARLFLELIRAGQDSDSVRKAITTYNDIRKNGLTPKT